MTELYCDRPLVLPSRSVGTAIDCEKDRRTWLSIKCPNCKLENPTEELRCDCGFEFKIPQTDLSLVLKELRTIKGMVAWWIALTLIGAFIAVLAASGAFR